MKCVSQSEPVARKQHQCNGCRSTIEPGEQYHSDFMVDGTDSWTWKSCQLCNSVWSLYYAYDGWDDWGSGVSSEYVEEWAKEFAAYPDSKSTPEEVAKVKSWINKCQEKNQ